MNRNLSLEIDHIHLDRKGLQIVVSELEAELLTYLWKHGPSTVRSIYEDVGRKKNVALTTIGVTLDRMHARGLTGREIDKGRGGLKYIYTASVSKEELGKSIAKAVVEKLSSAFGSSVGSYFSGE